jgi:hypothetical protein
LARPHDAPRRNTGKFFGALEFGDERVSIRAGWAAHDAPAELVANMASGILPGLVVGHRTFNGKEPLIVVGDDEEKRCGRVGRGRFSYNSQARVGHWGCLMMLPAGCIAAGERFPSDQQKWHDRRTFPGRRARLCRTLRSVPAAKMASPAPMPTATRAWLAAVRAPAAPERLQQLVAVAQF